MKRPALGIAVVGAGPSWTGTYRNIVNQMSGKVSVIAVCDPVFSRAAAVAQEFNAIPYSTLQALLRRSDIKSWLILDTDWYGIYPTELALQHGIHALLGNVFRYAPHQLQKITKDCVTDSNLVIPELPHRLTPSTIRIRELIATKLGPVKSIHVTMHGRFEGCSFGEKPPREVDFQMELAPIVDWCCCLTGLPVFDSHWNANEARLTFFLGESKTDEAAHARVVRISLTESGTDAPVKVHRLVECVRGFASSDTDRCVSWQSEGETFHETLGQDRSPFDLMFDQYCRRAAGGLIPAPNMNDLVHAFEVSRIASEQMSTEENN